MNYIDEKFKDTSPVKTVETIQNLLKNIGLTISENWNDSGVENCCSLRVNAGEIIPGANGKGVSKEFARASAYGEFIERLQSGLFFYKYQSFECDPSVNLQCFAPDAKYFTKEELDETADWMDYILNAYDGLTRQSLLKQFEMYAHTDDGKILCIPFYSLFEDKYVYLPAGFIEHIYSANGCCVGNSEAEALVHAFSEIMERKASIAAVTKGISFPRIPEEVLQSFPTVSKILARLRETDDLDVAIFDCSLGNGFPVISTRIINKNTHGYIVNFAADPVLEIAIQRTLTEIFQARNLKNIAPEQNKVILGSVNDMRSASNVLNQLETGKGYFAADYFADEITCDRKSTDFKDNSGLTNQQLLEKMLELYKEIGKPVLVRNYNFLGFPCYKVIVPGYSESRGMKLTETIQEYGIGHEVSKILRYPQKFTAPDFAVLSMFKKMIANIHSRHNNFKYLAGLPLDGSACDLLINVTFAYCAYVTNDMKTVFENLAALSRKSTISDEDKKYFECVKQYLTLKGSKVDQEKIFCVLNKFHKKQYVQKLEVALKNGTPFDEYLLKCDTKNCNDCRYKNNCHYDHIRKLIKNAGNIYSKFIDGQNREHFINLI